MEHNPCDYVSERSADNARPCAMCGEPAWDVCYETFLCDRHVDELDAEMNKHTEQLNARARSLMELSQEGGPWNSSDF